MFTLNCKGKIIAFDKPLVMGIINATPDSLYKGNLNNDKDEIRRLADRMMSDGADIIDIGGQSTRPGSIRVSAEEELERVLPVLQLIVNNNPEQLISIDTYHASVADAAINAGAHIINDISAGSLDENMIPTVGRLGVPYVCMHMLGTPETMQVNPAYNEMLPDILKFLVHKISLCRQAGIKDIIIDPGFGFGKTIDQNFSLLRSLEAFKIFECPVLVGLSRKSTIYKTLQVTVADALNGTTVMHTLALMNGADILRVHDVKEARQAVTLVETYKKAALKN